MKNFKPFGPSIGKTRISKKFIDKLNREFDGKSNSKKRDYSSKLASQIQNEVNFSNKYIEKNSDNYLAFSNNWINNNKKNNVK